MVPLHDSTRRLVAFAAVLLFGVAPTLAVWCWAAWWHSPQHVRWEEERLAAHLGLPVSLDGVRHPQPGVVVYEGFALQDPESGERIIRCPEVRVDWSRSADDGRAGEPPLHVAAVHPEINSAAWNEVWRLLDRVLSRRTGLPRRGLRLEADQLSFIGTQSPIVLAGLSGIVELGSEKPRPKFDDEPRAELRFSLAGEKPKEPARLRMGRIRQETPPSMAFELDSGTSSLPCSLLAMGLEDFALTGPKARFEGNFWAESSREGPRGRFAGKLTGVDLERLSATPLRRQLSGVATIQLDGDFQAGRVQKARGRILAGPGKVSPSLVNDTARWFGLTADLRGAPQDPVIPYMNLALEFQCDDKGLQLWGLSGRQFPPTILVGGDGGVILSQSSPTPARLPLASVAEALLPGSGAILPDAGEPDNLLRRLPQSQTPRVAGRVRP